MTTADPRPLAARRTPAPPAIPFNSVAAIAGKWSRRYGGIVLFLLAWQLASVLALADPSVIPSVTTVVAAMVDGFVDGTLLDNMLVSLGRSGLAFGLAVGLAIPLGLMMGSFRRFEELVDPLLQLFRQTAALAIYPIFILLLGLGETSKIAIIWWAAFFPALLSTISGVKLVDWKLIEMARVFGASRTAVFRRVVLPAATPAIFVGLRLSATISLLLLVAAEMIGAKKGLGFLIINSQYNFEIPLMFAAIVLLALIGLAVNAALLAVQKFLCRWETPRAAKAARIAALVLVAALPPWPAPAQAAAAAENVTVIRYLTSRGNVTSYEVASALGWMKDKGLRLDSVGFTQGGPESLVALAGGSVDIAGAATPAIINALAGGAKILGLLPGDGVSEHAYSRFYVLADSPIRAPQDLRDKSVAVNTLGAHLDYVIREYLRRNGLPERAANLIAVPGPQLEQVLRHKQADIVAVGEWQAIFAGKIEQAGGVRVLFTDYDVLGPIVLGSVAMKRNFVDAHPQAVRDFVTTAARAADWTAAHPDDAKRLVADILKERGENPDLAVWWPGFGVREHALYTDHDAQFWIDTLIRAGKLKPGQFTPEDVETNRFNDLAHLARQ